MIDPEDRRLVDCELASNRCARVAQVKIYVTELSTDNCTSVKPITVATCMHTLSDHQGF